MVINFIPGTVTQTRLQLLRKNIGSNLLLVINKKNNMHTTPPHTHIAFIMPRPKGIVSCHTRDNRCFNCKTSHSKRNEWSPLVIPVHPPLNDSVINTPQMSSVRQHPYSSSYNTTPESQDSSIPVRNSPDP